MKLLTSIPPRRDGTVNATGLDGAVYKFERNADGELACDIEHQPTVAFLLDGGLFFPADAADYEAAIALTADPDELNELNDPDDLGDGGNGLPIEANTPPAPARGKPGRKPAGK